MILALILFALIYILMLALPQQRPLHAGRRADGLRLPVVGVGVSTRLSQKTT